MVKVDTKRDGLLADYAVGMLKDFYMRKQQPGQDLIIKKIKN